MTQTAPQPRNKRLMLILVIPLLSCSVSSFVGIVLGQIGNLIYKAIGESGQCLVLPAFIGLFVLTFAVSFFASKLFRKWLIHS